MAGSISDIGRSISEIGRELPDLRPDWSQTNVREDWGRSAVGLNRDITPGGVTGGSSRKLLTEAYSYKLAMVPPLFRFVLLSLERFEKTRQRA